MKDLKVMQCRDYKEWKPDDSNEMFLEDLIKLCSHLKQHGYDVHPLHVDAAWCQYSDEYSAVWLHVGDRADSNVHHLLRYLDRVC